MNAAEITQTKARKKQLKSALTRYGKQITDHEANLDPDRRVDVDVIITINEFESTYKRLTATYDTLYAHIPDDDNASFEALCKDQETVFQQYLKVMKIIKILSPPTKTMAETQSSSTATSIPVKLPQLDLPKFGGAVEQWFHFKDLFESLINVNNSINDIQRFQYLKSSLFSEAAETIAELPTTATNYQVAWDLLKARFENKSRIVDTHLRQLVTLPQVTTGDVESLTLHINQFNKNIRALKQLEELNTDNILIHLSVSRLDENTKEKWAEYCQDLTKNKVIANTDKLLEFLSDRANVLRTKESTIPSRKSPVRPSSTSVQYKSVNTNQSQGKTIIHTCSICDGRDHRIYNCHQFANVNTDRRWQLVKDKKLCSNCLGKGHNRDSCSSKHRCMTCKSKHHTLLHLTNKPSHTPQDASASTWPLEKGNHKSSSAPLATTNPTSTLGGTGLVTNAQTKGFVFMPTAVIDIRDKNGSFHHCRALIDSASDVNIITNALATKLNLDRHQQNFHLEGIGSSKTNVSAEVTTTIRSQHQNYQRELDFVVVPKITSPKPAVNVQSDYFQIPANINLADPMFNVSQEVDVLLSAEIIHELIESGVIQVNKCGASAINTKLGWTISGKCATSPSHYNTLHISNKDLDNQLKRFWEIETIPYIIKTRESISETHFKNTTRRDDDGRFIVSLPFNEKLSKLGSTFDIANKQFHSLERRFQRNPKLHEQYSSNLHEYVNRGYMTFCEGDDKRDGYYLPHHAVFKTTSTTTKCRVVFNASAKSSTGVSLNDTLHVGPVIQDNLYDILVRFRKHTIVLTADIERMYLQVLMTPEHRKYQKMLWRSSPENELKTYTLNTVTFGEASAPFTATRCLNELGHIARDDLPNAARVISNDFYVDDCLTGCNTIREAHTLKRDLINVLKRGQFNLTKWRSNVPELSDETADTMISLSDAHMNTLGLMWNYQSDTLHFLLKFDNLSCDLTTKRTITSDACKLFDPLGLVAPVIITAKIIVQDLWKLKLDWDDPIPADFDVKWNSYKTALRDLHLIKIPRCVLHNSLSRKIELHGFCDSSIRAYGASLYIRTITSDNVVMTRLLCSKSRVSPTKLVSLPRLELSGAVLLAELIKCTINAIQMQTNRVVLWTDSTIVLQWIAGQSSDFNTFVGNRIGRIQDLTANYQWRHVRTNDNPADIISRGTSPVDLSTNSLWWSGPDFLSQQESTWPSTEFPITERLPEQRTSLATAVVSNQSFELSSRYSSLIKLKRIMAYINRFIYNCRNVNRRFEELSVDELENAMTSLIFMEQRTNFKEDIKALVTNKIIAPSSRLANLAPFMDDKGLLRVGGRLQHADIARDQKFPILLPTQNHLTNLIVNYTHLSLLHAGIQAVLYAVRLAYWPINGRSTVRQVVRNCVRCCRAKPAPQQHIMGQLPATRVQPGRAFIKSGLDFAGPFHIISAHRRGAKTTKIYLCIFVCFSTKAVHLELVGDLTSESCLGALKRFIARRGKVTELFSDNATNFVGCNNELRAVAASFADAAVQTQATILGIKWSFIPPRSPHFGGIWEAAVKSAKHHLKRVAGQASLTYEELTTLITQVEACLNSRPITPMSEDINDVSALTPGHFLIGQPLTAPVEHDLTNIQENRLSKWQRVQQLQQHFWKRWKQEYLSQMQVRAKWTKAYPSLKGGELVTLRDANSPPLNWPLGRVLKVHPGSDNVVRVATVKTADSVIKTSVSRLCLIPCEVI